MQFDCLCKKVLREYSRDIERQRKRRNEREVIFSGMSESEIANLYVKDEYPSDVEIAELMNMIRRTVQRRRSSSIEMIREQMEEDFYE